MAEKLKKHKDMAFIIGIGLFLAIVGVLTLSGMIVLPNLASAATQTVSVSATVNPWLTFSVNPTSAPLTPDLVDAAGGVAIGSSTNISLIVGTNSSGGWNITIQGQNGGLASTTNLIASVAAGAAASTTLVAGTNGYGANSTTTLTGVTVDPRYDKWGTVTVAAIASSTSQALASKGTKNASTTVATMKVYAAATSTQASAVYSDTITLTATSQ